MKKTEGFTFIELILYIGIVSIVLMALIPFAWTVLQSGAKNTTEQEVFSQARYISERLNFEIRNAIDINTSNSNFAVNLAQNPGNQVSLAVSGVNNPTIIDVTNGKVRITQGVNAPYFLESNDTQVTNLTFTNLSSGDGKTKHLQFTLSVKASYPGQGQEYVESTTIESSAEIRSH